ncbi:MAG: GNAT family N-acetyltransferase [Planctomycetota bacterium]
MRLSVEHLTVDRLKSLQGDDPLVRSWDSLADGNPFLSWEWLECWWRHYGPRQSDGRRQLLVIAVRDRDGGLVGLAPWYLDYSLLEGWAIRFLGSGEICSEYLTVPCKSGYQDAVSAALVRWLLDESPIRWNALDFSAVVPDDPFLTSLVGQLEGRGCKVCRESVVSCWRMELPGCWDEYLRSLSKSRRQKIRQLHRRFLESGAAVVHQVKTESELETGFSVLWNLHQSRRNSLGEPGCFVSPRFVAFHKETSRRLLERAQLQLNWVSIGEVPAAAEYSLKSRDTVFFYQSGIAPEMADKRPGWLSLTNSIRTAISQGYRYYDFLRGDEAYKASLGAKPRALVDIRVSHRHVPARVRHMVRQGAALAKAAINSVR